VWVPDGVHETVRDLVRAPGCGRGCSQEHQQLLSFLLRHVRIFMGHKHWTHAHRRWLAGQKFERPAQQIVFQDAIDAIGDATTRLQRIDEQLVAIVPGWSMAPVVAAYQAMRGVSFVVAVTFAAEIGDLRRFDKPRQVRRVMAFVGLVRSERSTGESVRRGDLTLAGNRRAGRVLPKAVREIAWKAQIRLCARYRTLTALSKKKLIVIAANACEMAAFLCARWAVGSSARDPRAGNAALSSRRLPQPDRRR
jgi:transposase